MYFTALYEECDTTEQIKDIRLAIEKGDTYAVKMVDNRSRENGVLCTVARPWLLFLHDKSEWNNFESNMA